MTFDVSGNVGDTFRLVAVYAPEAVKQNYFKRLEVFLETSLMLVGDWKSIFNARLDRVGPANRSEGVKVQPLPVD